MERFLLPRLESSLFLLSNSRASGLRDTGEAYTGTYAAAVEAQQIAGVVALCWNGTLLPQAPDAWIDELTSAAIDAAQRPVRAILGPASQVAAAYAGGQFPQAQMDETEVLFSLDLARLIVPEALRIGSVTARLIKERDLDLLVQWRTAYRTGSLGDADTPQLREQSRADLERSMREGRTWVLEEQGRPVATTSFNACIAEAAQVGGVWTPPELRGRGYARAAVAASLIDARNGGIGKAILFTPQRNIPAQRAYRALGFQEIGDYRVVLLADSMSS